MVLVGLGGDGPTAVGLPIPRPHLTVWNDLSDQTAVVYSYIGEMTPTHSMQRA